MLGKDVETRDPVLELPGLAMLSSRGNWDGRQIRRGYIGL